MKSHREGFEGEITRSHLILNVSLWLLSWEWAAGGQEQKLWRCFWKNPWQRGCWLGLRRWWWRWWDMVGFCIYISKGEWTECANGSDVGCERKRSQRWLRFWGSAKIIHLLSTYHVSSILLLLVPETERWELLPLYRWKKGLENFITG